MSRNLSPSASTPLTDVQSNGYLPFKNLAMQRMAKLLIDGRVPAQEFRLEVLRHLIYPKTLTHYPIRRHGWLAVLSIKTRQKLHKDGKLQDLAATIAQLEANTTLPPYERVGKIVATIKEATGKPFIRNSAFRQLMNGKYNEYVLTERLDEVHSIADALAILRDAAVESKPMTLLSTFPELFATSSIRHLMEKRMGEDQAFGGTMDSTLPAALLTVVRSMTPLRLQVGATRRELHELVIDHLDQNSPAYRPLLEVANSLPAAKMEDGSAQIMQILQFSFDNQMSLNGALAKPGFLNAANLLLEDKTITNGAFRAWLKHHAEAEYQKPALEKPKTYWGQLANAAPKESIDPLDTANRIMSAVKDMPVQHADSYASVLTAMADSYHGKNQKSRHPFVWALDALLAVDPTQPKPAFQRECAKVLYGVPRSLFPDDRDLVPAAKSLYDAIDNAVQQRFGRGAYLGSYVYGTPFIAGFPTYQQEGADKPEERDTSEDIPWDGDISIYGEFDRTENPPLHKMRMITTALDYATRRSREKLFGANPITTPTLKKQRLSIRPVNTLPPPVDISFLKTGRQAVDAEDAMASLGWSHNIQTDHTPLHQLIERAFARGDLTQDGRLRYFIELACQQGANPQATDDLNNSVIHEVLAKQLPAAATIEAVTALVEYGAHFAQSNHFGVPLIHMMPDDVQSSLFPVALSSITQHQINTSLMDAPPAFGTSQDARPAGRLNKTGIAL